MTLMLVLSSTCLGWSIFIGFKSVFMHDPVTLLSIGSPAFVENKSFPHSDQLGLIVHRFVPPRRLPKPGHGSSVGPRPRRILLILVAEEIPLILLLIPDPASICRYTNPSLMISLIQNVNEMKTLNHNKSTLQIPRFDSVEINVSDDIEIDLLRGDFLS